MAATTESDVFMQLGNQYLMEPFGFFFQEQGSWEELEKKIFLDLNDFGNSISGLPLPANSSSSSLEDEFKSPSLTRNLSFSTVSEELNSLSIEPQLTFNSSNSPREQAPGALEMDSKEGILASSGSEVYPVEDFSAMGLVFSGISNSELPSPSRPYASAMHRSHSLGQLSRGSSRLSNSGRGPHQISALDSTMQGLHACSGSILTQLLEVEDDPLQLEMKSRSTSSSSTTTSIRRVCSTGDLQRITPEAHDDGGFKIGRYSLAERKDRIHRYRQKRSERNFNKKIKYACRKTLADSRPRVRGRFAKNEDVVDSSCATFIPQQMIRHNLGEFDEEVEVVHEDEEGLLIDRQSSGELSESWGIRYVGR